jgi:hypothetical protein
MARLQFLSFEFAYFHYMAQVAFRAEVVPAQVEVYQCLSASSMCVDSLLCHFGKEGSRLCDFHEPLPGVFSSQCLSWYAQENQCTASSVLRLRREVC